VGLNFKQFWQPPTGDVEESDISNKWYGEVHTCDAWLPARDRFCIANDENYSDMSVGLIVFGDKSHTDLHCALSLTPIIFMLSLFNRVSCNSTIFWRPLAMIPNLGYGKNRAGKTDKDQNLG
jgi:hypothetical protein